MIFGRVRLAEAQGGILAHNLDTANGVLRKGALVDGEAFRLLTQAGHEMVTIARLEPGDVPEGQAAARLGDLLLAPGLRRSGDVNGRVNLFALADGLLRLDREKITRLNRLDEAIALATLPDGAAVKRKDMIATLKIIPFAVPGATMAQAETLIAAGGETLGLKPFRPLRAGLIVTTSARLKPSTIAGTIAATATRVAAHGGTLLPHLETLHDAALLAAAITELLAAGAELVLISGASAVTDRLDTAPRGIVLAGGRITHFGMPVDPGNLICFGEIGGKPAIVLPGCARSPALNGIDWVLDRLFANEALGATEIAALGAGGLLKEIRSRPAPREARKSAGIGAAPQAVPPVAALVLAAGRSTRMGNTNKLLAPMPDGAAMIARTVDNVCAGPARPVIVVTGFQDREIRNALSGKPVRFLHAAEFARGMSASLRAGIAALSAEIGAALICHGDMPLIGPAVLRRIAAAHDPARGHEIVIPTFDGQRGNPVLWGKRFFPELLKLTGDAGARQIIHRFTEFIVEIPVETDAILRDFDTPEMLAFLYEGGGL